MPAPADLHGVSSLSPSSPFSGAGGPFAARLKWLRDGGRAALIRQGLRGVEKESLRVGEDGTLSRSPHPTALGAALTHPFITTDYSEALPELVTPPQRTQWETLQFLCDVHAFIAAALGGELLWPASMPCELPADDEIPIADYGPSNLGRMKTVYRRGLGHRYGRAMQAIAGVHFNYSLPPAFWPEYRAFERRSEPLCGVSLGRAHGARAQLSPLRVARDVPDRRLAGALPLVSAGRPRAARRARFRDVVCAVCDLAAHERLGLPQQDARTLEHPREFAGRIPRGHPQRRDDRGAALRGDRRRRRRRVSAAQREHPADRERVLQHDPPEAEQGEQVAGRSLRSPKPVSTTSRCERSISAARTPSE